MDRRGFIVKSCSACVSVTALSGLLSACAGTRYVAGTLGMDGITVSTDEFKKRPFIIVRHDALQYPVYVYRFSDTEYSAVWMRCTHQGTELQASGNYLQCPAHGSEFSNKGKVTNGPADNDLRVFPVTVTNNELFIDLRKI